MSRRHRLAGGLALVCATALTAGCVGLPTTGEVQLAPEGGAAPEDTAPYFSPPPPRAGDTEAGIVSGFLLAMQANPLTTSVARRYLTTSARTDWEPSRGTVIYSTYTVGTGRGAAEVQLTRTRRLDARGVWQGVDSNGRRELRLRLVKERGEWRIANPPDALLVPDTYFATRFTQASLYYVDPTGTMLVPEPVYVPRGAQTATLLVRALLSGPGKGLGDVERSFFPTTVSVDLSVTVGPDGTAEVPLTDLLVDVAPTDLDLMADELAWTLGQVTGVDRVRMTVDDAPVTLPDGTTEADTTSAAELDPSGFFASRDLFGLRGGEAMVIGPGSEQRLGDVLGDLGVRSFSVDLTGERVATVSEGGTVVTVAARTGTDGASQVLTGGVDLQQPHWDVDGGLWMLDRRADGAVVLLRRGGVTRDVVVPGVSGEDVRAFTVSRDGTRLVAAIAGGPHDRVVVSRVVRGPSGSVDRVLPAESLGSAAWVGLTEIRDLGWRSPSTLAVLGLAPGAVTRLQMVSVDGSEPPDALTADPFREDAVRVVTSPAPGSVVYLVTRSGGLYSLTTAGRWTRARLGDVRAATYAG